VVTGQLRWEYPTHCSLAPKVVALRQTFYLYCPETDLSSGAQPTFSIRALSSVQPQQLWAFDTMGYSGQFMISNGDVLFVETYGKVIAVDAVSGKAVWEYSTGVGSFAAAAATKDVLYLYSTAGVVEALDIATQKQLWRVKVDPVASPTLAVDAFRLLLLGRRQIASVLATDSGAMYFRLPVGTQLSRIAETVAAGTYYGQVKGLVSDSIVATDIGPTMPKKWEALTPMFNDRRVTVSSFAYANGYLWVGSGPAGLHAYEASSGRLASSTQMVGETNAIVYVVPANGMVFAGTRQGKLYAYGKP
ncbi:MAG: PQQ-binding-like beta-propeller repeat protein, partial [Chloroflexota bacterium]